VVTSRQLWRWWSRRTAATPAVSAGPLRRTCSILGSDDGGALVACCQVERRRDGTCYFGMFSVAPSAQGGGLGRAMLAEAERVAREEWGAMTMRMTVIKQRDDLIAWYARRGYEATEEMHAFPYGDERFGIPRRDDLEFRVLTKTL
jgi:GNAT superfamily N-acetyltransferase